MSNEVKDGVGYKKIIAVVSSLALLWAIYYGSYLPFKKSQSFIDVLRNMANMTSIEEIESSFSAVFAVPSPIGQEELVRHFANIALQTAQQSGRDNPELTKRLVAYLENAYDPIIGRGRGMSFNQNLFLLGAINHVAFVQTQEKVYLDRAIELFEEGRSRSPHRPQFLYQLFDVYRLAGDQEKASEVGEKIIELWPNDTRIKSQLDELRGSTSA